MQITSAYLLSTIVNLIKILDAAQIRTVYWTPVIDLIVSSGIWANALSIANPKANTALFRSQPQSQISPDILLEALKPHIETATKEETISLLEFSAHPMLLAVAQHTPHTHLVIPKLLSNLSDVSSAAFHERATALFLNPNLSPDQRLSFLGNILPFKSDIDTANAYCQSLKPSPITAPELELFVGLVQQKTDVRIWYRSLSTVPNLAPHLAEAMTSHLIPYNIWNSNSNCLLFLTLLNQVEFPLIPTLLDTLFSHPTVGTPAMFSLRNALLTSKSSTLSSRILLSHILPSRGSLSFSKSEWEEVLSTDMVTPELATLALSTMELPHIRRALARGPAKTNPIVRARLLKSTDIEILGHLLDSSTDPAEYNSILAPYATKAPVLAAAHLASATRPSIPVARQILARIIKGLGASADPEVRNQIMALLATASQAPSSGPLPKTPRSPSRA